MKFHKRATVKPVKMKLSTSSRKHPADRHFPFLSQPVQQPTVIAPPVFPQLSQASAEIPKINEKDPLSAEGESNEDGFHMDLQTGNENKIECIRQFPFCFCTNPIIKFSFPTNMPYLFQINKCEICNKIIY